MEDMDITIMVTLANTLDLMVDDPEHFNFGDSQVLNTFQSEDLRKIFVVLSDGQVIEVSARQVAPPRR